MTIHSTSSACSSACLPGRHHAHCLQCRLRHSPGCCTLLLPWSCCELPACLWLTSAALVTPGPCNAIPDMTPVYIAYRLSASYPHVDKTLRLARNCALCIVLWAHLMLRYSLDMCLGQAACSALQKAVPFAASLHVRPSGCPCLLQIVEAPGCSQHMCCAEPR